MSGPQTRLERRPDRERHKRYRRGRWAEFVAAALLMAKGYRVLARRYRCQAGEIDLIVRRGARIAFVEVKRRPTLEEAQGSITPRQRERMRRAAMHWLARHERYRDCELGLDVVLLVARRLPVHVQNALFPR